MNLATTMDSLATAMQNISGLRCYGWPNFAASPPCGLIGYPDEIRYDLTFQATKGVSSGDSATFKVWVVTGDQVERTARDTLSKLVSSDEARSIKKAIEQNVAFTCAVKTVKIVTVTMSSVEYLAAEFEIEVWG